MLENDDNDDESSMVDNPTTSLPCETPDFVNRCLVQLEEALSIFPVDEKQEYELARRAAPHLFEEEVYPLKFLRRDDYDPWAAANRLALYWKHRKRVFKDRWLLPLSLALRQGPSAFTELDVAVWRSGFCIMIDEYAIFNFQHLTDFAVQNPQYTEQDLDDSRTRLIFYCFTVLTNEHSQRVGRKTLMIPNGVTASRIWKSSVNIGPVKNAGLYLAQYTHRLSDKWATMWIKFFSHIALAWFRKAPTLLLASNPEEMLHKCLDAGFPLELLPQELGGPWRHDDHHLDEWMQVLLQRDQARSHRMAVAAAKTYHTTASATIVSVTQELARDIAKLQAQQRPSSAPTDNKSLPPVSPTALTWVDYRQKTWMNVSIDTVHSESKR